MPAWKAAWLLLFVAAATLPGSGARRAVANCVAVVACTFIWSSDRVLGMGDTVHWRVHAESAVALSCPMASLVNAVTFRFLGLPGLEGQSVLLGGIATLAWLRAMRILLPDSPWRRFVWAVTWIGSGNMLLFHYGYVEQTQLGISMWILAVAHLASAARSQESLVRHRWQMAIFGGLAACTHLLYLAQWLAVLVAWGVLRGRRDGLFSTLLSCVVAVTGVFALVALLAHCFSLPWYPGNVQDSGDYLRPFVGMGGSPFAEPGCLSAGRILDLSNILAFACPGLLLLPAVAVLTGGRTVCRMPLPLCLAAGGYLGFAWLYSFDLGWPIDADLMLATSPGLLLFIAFALARGKQGLVAKASMALLLVLAVLPTTGVIEELVRPTSSPASQNQPVASLVAPGMVGESAPYSLKWDATRVVRLEIAGPPGAPFLLICGRPQVAAGGHPFGGSCDVLWPGSNPADSVFHIGQLDALGSAVVETEVPAVPGSALTGVQAMVGVRTETQFPIMTAAIYLQPSAGR